MDEPRKIVLMEDSRTTRKLASTCLEKRGYRIWEADEGRSAIELVLREKPDLLLADIILPDMHGSEVVRQLLESSVGDSLKILFTTSLLARGGFAGCETTLAIDGKRFPALGKPYHPDVLVELVDRLLGGPN